MGKLERGIKEELVIMSYGRNPYYIFSTGETLFLNGIYVDEEIINAFLYKILLTNRREELMRRLQNGKTQWTDKLDVEWMEMVEDNILKELMGTK